MTDIFISFAHQDNKPIAEGEKGWITHWVTHLRNEVGRKLGRAEYLNLWMDFRLQGNHAVTPEIESKLRETRTLVILLSKSWLKSTWCQHELAFFSQHAQTLNNRIFTVELEPIALKDKPVVLHDLLTYQFWRKTDQDEFPQLGYPVPQPTDSAYFTELLRVAKQLAATLEQLKSASDVSATQITTDTTPTFTPQATIYFAPVRDELYEQRASLISELRQFSIDVLPRNNNDWDETSMATDLAHCSHFVQLLDVAWTFGIPHKQHAQAVAAGKTILQWRDAKLELAQVREEKQKTLLEGKDVRATSLTNFAQEVQSVVLPKPRPPGREETVFIHAGPEDAPHAEEVKQRLEQDGYCTVVPDYQGDPTGVGDYVKTGYESCDVWLLLQKTTPSLALNKRILEALPHFKKRPDKPTVMLCRPASAERPRITLPGMITLDCAERFEQQCAEQVKGSAK